MTRGAHRLTLTRLIAVAAACCLWLVTTKAAEAADNQATGELVDRTALRVCADPSYLPFSNQAGRGFENKIADVIARELGVPVLYTWYPRSAGFVRNTLRARACDVIIGITTGDELVQNTNPYYRSAYVMAVRTADAAIYPDLDAPGVRNARIGVVAGTPPADLILQRGLLRNLQAYPLIVDPRFDNQGQKIMEDLAAGRIDVAMGWGPLIGYWARAQSVPITMVPLASDRERGIVMDFRLSLGIRPGEPLWKHELERVLRRVQPELEAILASYGVPLLDNRGRLMTTVAASPETTPPTATAAVPEPEGYRTEAYRAPVPATLRGATVLDGEGLERLVAEARPILVDVLPLQPRPANRPVDAIWIDKRHDHIEGSVWLPNTGYGNLPAATLDYLRNSLATLTGGEHSRPLVFYCDANCWMSWNAAKRASSELGYTAVYWLPDGAVAWAARGHALVPAEIYDAEAAGLAH